MPRDNQHTLLQQPKCYSALLALKSPIQGFAGSPPVLQPPPPRDAPEPLQFVFKICIFVDLLSLPLFLLLSRIPWNPSVGQGHPLLFLVYHHHSGSEVVSKDVLFPQNHRLILLALLVCSHNIICCIEANVSWLCSDGLLVQRRLVFSYAVSSFTLHIRHFGVIFTPVVAAARNILPASFFSSLLNHCHDSPLR